MERVVQHTSRASRMLKAAAMARSPAVILDAKVGLSPNSLATLASCAGTASEKALSMAALRSAS